MLWRLIWTAEISVAINFHSPHTLVKPHVTLKSFTWHKHGTDVPLLCTYCSIFFDPTLLINKLCVTESALASLRSDVMTSVSVTRMPCVFIPDCYWGTVKISGDLSLSWMPSRPQLHLNNFHSAAHAMLNNHRIFLNNIHTVDVFRSCFTFNIRTSTFQIKFIGYFNNWQLYSEFTFSKLYSVTTTQVNVD